MSLVITHLSSAFTITENVKYTRLQTCAGVAKFAQWKNFKILQDNPIYNSYNPIRKIYHDNLKSSKFE